MRHSEKGKIEWFLLWILGIPIFPGIPITILLVLFVLRGHT